MKWSEFAQSCPTLWDPMDCSLPGSSVHGIFQARVLEWVAISLLLSHKKEQNWVICRNVGGLWEHPTEWIIQKEKNKYHKLIHNWNLEKWYRWFYLQNRNRDTDVKNKSMAIKTEGGMEGIGRFWVTYIHYWFAMYKMDNWWEHNV